MRKKLRLILFVFILVAMQLFANEKFDYGKGVKLKGKLITILYYGSPGFGENPKNDKKVYPYILILNKKIDVNGNDSYAEEKDVEKIQITFSSEVAEKVKKLKGKNVELSGELFHSDNGNHYTDVLIDIKNINEDKF